MPSYVCTFVVSPELSPFNAHRVGAPVKMEADNRRLAGKKALLGKLPKGADRLDVHVCPMHPEEDAGFELFTEEEMMLPVATEKANECRRTA